MEETGLRFAKMGVVLEKIPEPELVAPPALGVYFFPNSFGCSELIVDRKFLRCYPWEVELIAVAIESFFVGEVEEEVVAGDEHGEEV